MAESNLSSPHLPIRTILVPQGAEYRAVNKGCKRARAAVSVVPLPMGPAAASSLERWLKKYRLFAHDGYLLVGLGGGLAPSLKIGDGVLCETSQDVSNTELAQFDPILGDWIQQRLPQVQVGQAVVCDHIIPQAAEKQRLYRQLGTSLVEMESLSIFNVLQKQGKRMAMLRVISDDCHHDMPEIGPALRPDGSLAFLPLATQLIRQPLAGGRLVVGSLKALAQLEELIFQLFRENKRREAGESGNGGSPK
jgi:nucleoside phosphorylase